MQQSPRESLSDLIEGRLSFADGRAELVKLATRLIVEEALEAESYDASAATTTSMAHSRAGLGPTACVWVA